MKNLREYLKENGVEEALAPIDNRGRIPSRAATRYQDPLQAALAAVSKAEDGLTELQSSFDSALAYLEKANIPIQPSWTHASEMIDELNDTIQDMGQDVELTISDAAKHEEPDMGHDPY
jgi:hypothetical protein